MAHGLFASKRLSKPRPARFCATPGCTKRADKGRTVCPSCAGVTPPIGGFTK